MSSDLQPVTLFIEPPSLEALEKRLRGRGTDRDDVIEKRLQNAISEMAQKDRYQYRLINDDLDQAVREILAVFAKELS